MRREAGGQERTRSSTTTEFMHPRMEEVLEHCCRAAWAEADRGAAGSRQGCSTASLIGGEGFATGDDRPLPGSLPALAGLKALAARIAAPRPRARPHRSTWLERSSLATVRTTDYDLAVEALACRRLVKGYSDTHARGLSKFDRVLAEVPSLLGRPDSAAWLRRLKEAALADEKGLALDGALQTMRSAYG